jgi:hypothetical protein
MLLLNDEDELPNDPSDKETSFVSQLGTNGLEAIEARIVACTTHNWSKVARIVLQALSIGGFAITDEIVNVHVRLVAKLVISGVLESQGNVSRPRFSEIRLPFIRQD